jgi:pyruvate dehydrogenase E1 component beta subunit
MDAETIRASVRKTGRLVVADEAGPICSAASEVATLATEDPDTFAALKTPVKRVCALPVPIPYAPVMEDHVFPNRTKIADAVREVMAAKVVRH